MAELFMPGNIIYGKNSLNKLTFDKHGHVLVISNGGFTETRGFLSCVEDKVKRSAGKVSVIVNGNIHELYAHATEIYFGDEYDFIVAIGSAEVIDCAMLLSKESEAPFTAIPICSACALTDFESEKYYEYRKSPERVVLDPQLMHCVSSGAIAYDGLSCLAFAIDALCENADPIIHSFAFDSTTGIIKNIIPAFRGNMKAMESLMYSMYLAVAAHRNIKSSEHSLISRVCEFFASFGYSKTAVLAVCIPSLVENSTDVLKDTLFELAITLKIGHSDNGKETLTAKMIDEIRKIQATLSVPRSISGFGLEPERFNAEKYGSDIPADLLELCYNGSFRFMKI